ncbi:hypothetical protein N9W78_00040 [bacterium]|nr:hypothetical protein [bacterium]
MPYQYTGRYTEATTGLVHLDARWYNPQTQRFVQPDLWNFRNTGLPMAVRHELMRFTGLDTAQLLREPGQQMGYGYVSGNPLAWSDLLGLCDPKLVDNQDALPVTPEVPNPDTLGLNGSPNVFDNNYSNMEPNLEDVTENPLYPADKTDNGTVIQLNGPKTDLPSGANLMALSNFADATGQDSVLINGGQEAAGHSQNSLHGQNLAIDVAGSKFNNLTHEEVASAASDAGYTHGVYENFDGENADHWHLQMESGNGLDDQHLTSNGTIVIKDY